MVRTALLWSVKAAGVRGCAKGEDLPGAGAGGGGVTLVTKGGHKL